MSKDLQTVLNAPSLAERLRGKSLTSAPGGSLAARIAERLKGRSKQSQCLLLDVSGSMESNCGDGRSKLAALKAIAQEFLGTRQFSFSDECVERPPQYAESNTNMARAFATIKSAGITHVVLITDGQPDSEDAALRAAVGLTIDIVYVGPQPEPPFLARLAQLTGGQYGAGSLAQQKQIEQRVHQLLLEKK